MVLFVFRGIHLQAASGFGNVSLNVLGIEKGIWKMSACENVKIIIIATSVGYAILIN